MIILCQDEYEKKLFCLVNDVRVGKVWFTKKFNRSYGQALIKKTFSLQSSESPCLSPKHGFSGHFREAVKIKKKFFS